EFRRVLFRSLIVGLKNRLPLRPCQLAALQNLQNLNLVDLVAVEQHEYLVHERIAGDCAGQRSSSFGLRGVDRRRWWRSGSLCWRFRYCLLATTLGLRSFGGRRSLGRRESSL